MKKIVGLLVLCLFLLAGTVSAAYVTIRPDGAGSKTNWNKFNCANNWDCVDETPANTTDYVGAKVGSVQDLYTFSNTGLSWGTPITSLTVYYYNKLYTSSSKRFAPLLRMNGTGAMAVGTAIDAGSTWAYNSETFTINPITGVSWTRNDIDYLEIGMQSDSTTNPGGLVAQVYAEVNY